jgi:deoxyribodipyrimidine photo-lyase
MPLSLSEKDAPTAYVFRRFLQKNLPEQLMTPPIENPLKQLKVKAQDKVPTEWTKKWKPTVLEDLLKPGALDKLPIDHSVPVVPEILGGEKAARETLAVFLEQKLDHYAEERSEPEKDYGSGLAPYLHFGQISVHEVFQEIARKEKWNPSKLSSKTDGSKEGWWGMSANAESFLDEIITWREVGFHFCYHRPDHDKYESLPQWARATLEEHAKDGREYVYTLKQFEEAQTHDPLWNAAQTQLVREGKIHNYLRMIWGKKIIEWTDHPREALKIMIELNNKWAIDGRDPNSYSGIFWCLGRFDRPWAPLRPVFGSIRWMSSANTAKKFKVKGYLAKYGQGPKELFN